MKYCPECGFENPVDAKFCGNCNFDFSKFTNKDKTGSGGVARKIRTGLIIAFIFLIVIFLFLFSNSNLETDVAFLEALQFEFLKIDLSGISLPDWLPLPTAVRSYFANELKNSGYKHNEEEGINSLIEDNEGAPENPVSGAQQQDTPDTQITPTKKVASTIPPKVQSTKTPKPTDKAADFSCSGAPKTRMDIGIKGRVSYTDGTPLRLRREPFIDLKTNYIKDLSEGTRFTILDGPVCKDEYVWWKIRTNNDHEGWSAEGDYDEYFMEPYDW